MEFMSVGDCAFRVLRLMGKWKGSYSYLVEDDKGTYVLKQIHHEPCDYYQFSDKFASAMQADYLRQICEMCKHPYVARMNIDYSPTNSVVQDGLLYYIDYECNDYMSQ